MQTSAPSCPDHRYLETKEDDSSSCISFCYAFLSFHLSFYWTVWRETPPDCDNSALQKVPHSLTWKYTKSHSITSLIVCLLYEIIIAIYRDICKKNLKRGKCLFSHQIPVKTCDLLSLKTLILGLNNE